ncbi:MAG: amino acid adenylation domain-containing protein, partial [Acutalibacteraceae bacterium]|nr:amino acid adenylation domain-containing protein [Acutalibacteraceae bacterium]
SVYVAPRNETEEIICRIFSEILGTEKISVNDSFFELGGHSLRATRLVNRINVQTKHRIALKDVFSHPTPELLAKLVDDNNSETYIPIPKAEKKSCYPMSSTQKRMFLISEMSESDSLNYNLPQAIRLTGQVDVEQFRNAFTQLIMRHEILRTKFVMHNGLPMQYIEEQPEINFVYLEDMNSDEKQLLDSLIHPFALNKPSQIRMYLIRRREYYILLLDMHHIISDGMSVESMLHELEILYNGNVLTVPKLQYKDYSEWFCTRNMQQQKDYWLKQFEDEIPITNLPNDFPRKQQQNFNGKMLYQFSGKKLATGIQNIIRKYDVTDYMIFMSAVMILIGKYCRQDDVVIGTPMSARTHPDTENILGMFVNTVALRAKPENSKKYTSFLNEIKTLCLKAYENQEYPFEDLVKELNLTRDMSRNPLFDVMFVLQNNEIHNLNFKNIQTEYINLDMNISKFDLTFNVDMLENEYCVGLEFCTDLFTEDSAQFILKHYFCILQQLVQNPDTILGDIKLLTQEESQMILKKFNATSVTYKEKTVVELFEKQVEKMPDNTALVFENKNQTYAELNERANSLAHKLREKGIKPDDFVAIIADRSIEMIVGIYGIIKAGGAYVPIDPTHPEERIKFILEDCVPKVVLKYTKKNIEKICGEIPVIDLSESELWKGMTENPEYVNTPNNLIYCIYTSGTTGKPKGVMIEHNGIINLGIYMKNELNVISDDRVMLFANYIFDGSIWEILMAHMNGATLYIPNDETIKDIIKMEEYINKNQITVSYFPPAYYQQGKLELTNYVVTAGSQAGKSVVKKALKNSSYINSYGPTEATICTSNWIVEKNSNVPEIIPIGKPISNKQVYIMDGNSLCGIGVPGELCIAGDGLARGYLNREKLTEEKFVKNPFREGRMYRSGDLARWLPDGNIEFLGRIDEQVKIRGFRIELGEIQSRICEIDNIKDCAVIAKADVNGNNAIYAYYVSEEDTSISEIRNKLSEVLPEYMIPTYMMQIDEIPVNSSGKVNRRALPEITTNFTEEYVAPENDIQKILCDVFAEVLHVSQVGITNSYFEMGGDSIKGIQIIAKLREHHLYLSTKDILSGKTILRIAELVKYETKELYSQDAYSGFSEGTPIQMQFLTKWKLNRPNYFNQSMVIQATYFQRNALYTALDKVLFHHDMLRARVRNNFLYIVAPNELPLYDFYELDARNRSENWITEQCEKIQQSMQLTDRPLVKVAVIQRNGIEYLALFIHHLVIDAVSWNILIEDLKTAYQQNIRNEEIYLPEKTASIQEWSELLKEYKNMVVLNKEVSYWQKISEQACKCCFRDSEVPDSGNNTMMAMYSFDFGTHYTEALLYQVNEKFNTDVNDILLTALAISVSDMIGEKTIALVLEGHGRQELHKKIDISRTVGWFTTIYPVVLTVQDDMAETVVTVKDTLHNVPNKGIGFSLLMNELGLDLNRIALGFNYLGEMEVEQKNNKEFQPVDLDTGNDVSLENKLYSSFSINLYISRKHLKCNIMYDANQYRELFVKQFCEKYNITLQKLINFLLRQQTCVQTASDILKPNNMSNDELAVINSAIGELLGL